MQVLVDGFEITEEIHKAKRTTVYRGIQKSDNTPVIIKVLNSVYPSIDELSKLRHEFEIANIFDTDGVVRALALQKNKNGLAIILEDFGGDSLEKVIRKDKLDLNEFLLMAEQLSQILGDIHKQEVIHKDIKPHSIIINLETNKIKITDF